MEYVHVVSGQAERQTVALSSMALYGGLTSGDFNRYV